MVPADVALNHSQLFFTRALGGKARVLEVGCGNGQLAWRLAHLGLEVVGLDIALPAERPSHPALRFEKADFFQYKDEPFDAVIFTASLHHLNPLEGAVRRARNLLKPAGLIAVDDFDHLAPDDATLRWYYEAQGLLAHAGVLSVHQHAGHGAHAGSENDRPLSRWQTEHAHSPPLHSGETMLAALRTVGELSEVSRGAYLYRCVNGQLGTTARDLNVAEWMLATEERRVRSGTLKGVGLRVICRTG
jgi:SAM-dependent methyltransferase